MKTEQEKRPSTEQANNSGKLKSTSKLNPKWSRTIVNFWLDTAMLVVFLAVIWVTTVIRFLFPPAGSSRAWTLWSLTLDGWIQIQFALLALFAFGVLVHVMLHWTWICGVLTSRLLRRDADGKPRTMDDGTRTIAGVGLMIVLLNLLAVLVVAAALSIEGP